MDEKNLMNDEIKVNGDDVHEIDKNEEFDFSYSAPNTEEKRWIESIRREYLPRDEHEDKVIEIKRLHKKVKKVPSAIAIVIGIVGTLIMGAGMSMTLEFNQLVGGIIVGIVGMAIMLFTYPIYQFMVTRGKKKYGDKIIKLADEIESDNKKTDSDNDKTEL